MQAAARRVAAACAKEMPRAIERMADGLASVDPVANEAGKAQEGGASHLETPRPLHGDLSHHPQRLFRCAEANQALDKEGPAHQREHERYPRPDVMKPDDDGSQWQVQKPVHERRRLPPCRAGG